MRAPPCRVAGCPERDVRLVRALRRALARTSVDLLPAFERRKPQLKVQAHAKRAGCERQRGVSCGGAYESIDFGGGRRWPPTPPGIDDARMRRVGKLACATRGGKRREASRVVFGRADGSRRYGRIGVAYDPKGGRSSPVQAQEAGRILDRRPDVLKQAEQIVAGALARGGHEVGERLESPCRVQRDEPGAPTNAARPQRLAEIPGARRVRRAPLPMGDAAADGLFGTSRKRGERSSQLVRSDEPRTDASALEAAPTIPSLGTAPRSWTDGSFASVKPSNRRKSPTCQHGRFSSAKIGPVRRATMRVDSTVPSRRIHACRARSEVVLHLTDSNRRTLSVSDAAAQLGVSERVVRAAARAGGIPAIVIGRKVLVLRVPFERLLAGEDLSKQRAFDHTIDSRVDRAFAPSEERGDA